MVSCLPGQQDMASRGLTFRTERSGRLAGCLKILPDAADNRSLFFVGQFREYGQRQRFARGRFAARHTAGAVTLIRKTCLQVKRHRVVDFRPDSVLGQLLSQGVALAAGDTNDVLIPNVATAGYLLGQA